MEARVNGVEMSAKAQIDVFKFSDFGRIETFNYLVCVGQAHDDFVMGWTLK